MEHTSSIVSINSLYNELMKHIEKVMAFQEALALFEWDAQTLAPDKAMDNTAKTIGILSNEYFTNLVNDEVKHLIYQLCDPENQGNLDFNQKAIIKSLKKTFDKMEPIPPEEFQAYSELTAQATGIWVKAKENKNYDEFAPTLEKIIEYQKKFAGYRKKENQNLYDVLLDDFEEGFTMEKLDVFFAQIKKTIVPLVQEVAAKKDQINNSFNFLEYDVDKQKEFCKFISEYVGFDYSRGVLAESAHPFTMQLHNKDVRITTHFMKNNLESAIFSTIHETGHGLYELNIDDAITQTPVGTGTSMGIHESQSRFFENIVGRSKAFWEPVYGKLQATFPEQLTNVSLDSFIKGINKSVPGLIRTEADELTYSLHVMIRYEIEKMIFADEVSISELPELWRQKYQEYLGISPQNYSEGILQDVHWAGGSFGYFPSYALGSAIAAQIYYHMLEKMPFETYLKEGNLAPIRDYLKEHIHRFGETKNTSELLLDMMDEGLNAEYYCKYLTSKFA